MILWIIHDCFLIIKYHILAPFIKPQPKWLQGTKGDIVLIQGFGGNFLFYEKIADYLAFEGYRAHIFNKLNTFDIVQNIAAVVVKYIQNHNLKNFVIIGHSKGGIVAKYIANNFPDIADNCKQFIAICAPFKGTVFAYMHILNMWQLIPGSAFLKELCANTTNNHKFISLRAKLDNLVIPNKNTILESVQNFEVDVAGHTNILVSDRLLSNIKAHLNV